MIDYYKYRWVYISSRLQVDAFYVCCIKVNNKRQSIGPSNDWIYLLVHFLFFLCFCFLLRNFRSRCIGFAIVKATVLMNFG